MPKEPNSHEYFGAHYQVVTHDMLVSFYGLEVRQVQSGSRQVGMKNKTRTVKRTEKVQKLLVIIKNINDDGIHILFRARCSFLQLVAKNMSKQIC